MGPVKQCILCPGQGAQAVGMGKDFYDQSVAAREAYQTARTVLGWDVAAVCFEGPEERLNQTDVSQPAIYVTSVACYRAACEAGLIDPLGVGVFAGLSLGEYTALHLAGAFGFEAGLRLVAARGRYMQEAAEATRGGMVAVLGAEEEAVAELCRQGADGQTLVCANFNAPGQIVVSGTIGACERLLKLAEGKGLKALPLKVAGAFHSPLMQAAADRMKLELAKVDLRRPRAPVYANVTAQPHAEVEAIKGLLVEQVVRPVRWEQSMRAMLAAGEWRLIELAPGRTLAGMAKRINRRLAVESLASFEALVGAKETR